MQVILDFPGGRRVFEAPQTVITADTAAQAPDALAAIDMALAAGKHVAGWFGYELGYALEPKLEKLLDAPARLLRLGVFDAPTDAAPAPHGRAYAGPLRHDWNEASYGARFAVVKEKIAAGDIYQANLSYRARFHFLGDARAFYEGLRVSAQAGWCGFVDDGEQQIVSLSPEQFFDLSADGRISVRPMKGTAPRAGRDAAEREALAASAKNRAENLMIVDLIRNDLGRIARTGSVQVEKLFAVETYPTLHAMVSTVTAQQRQGAGLTEVLRALFPCGSVTGAPKIRAMEILRQLEDTPRGAYCGAVGHFAPDGSAQFNVAIRTATISGSQGVLGLGGGVVQDSEAADEYAECLLKARFFEAERRPLHLIETLRWDGVFVRLQSHLARMATSADASVWRSICSGDRGAGKVSRGREGRAAGASDAGRGRPVPRRGGSPGPNPSHWTYEIASEAVSSTDALQHHKTSWREVYDQPSQADERLFCNERGELVEGSRSNIFVARDGTLLTPPLSAGALDGRLRAELIANGQAREATLFPHDLADASAYCGNSLRGLIAIRPFRATLSGKPR